MTPENHSDAAAGSVPEIRCNLIRTEAPSGHASNKCNKTVIYTILFKGSLDQAWPRSSLADLHHP